MKKTSIIIALAVLSAASCTKEKEFVSFDETVITAVREDASTRTAVQADGKSVWWTPGDEIDVFAGGSSATFATDLKEAAASAQFKGNLAVAGKSYTCIYPSSVGNAVAADGSVTLELSASQTAVSGTFATNLFPAVGRSEASTVTFRNVAGGIKFSVDEEDVTEVAIRGNSSEPIAGSATFELDESGIPSLRQVVSGSSEVTVAAPNGGFVKGEVYFAALLPAKLDKGITITLKRAAGEPVEIVSDKAREIKRGTFGNVGALKASAKELQIENVWVMYSTSSAAWNEYFGGAPDSDRNIAMDDEYVYIAEAPQTASTTPKLWAISLADHKTVKEVNVEGVSGGARLLCCPRVLKNTDSAVNGGKDVLICSNLTRGGEEPKLYMWVDGIDKAPKVITLTTWAEGSWYGDTFTVSGTLQDGILFFDKTDSSGNGVVTFNLNGVPAGDKLYLLKRIKFNDAMGSHGGVCAYYPFPGNDNAGVYSPGRGVEARGRSAVFEGNLKSDGNAAYAPALTNLDYAEGRNGWVLGYNFLEWEGKRYVIYGKQPSRSEGFVYVLEGEITDSWLDIVNKAPVKFRRDLAVESGSKLSSNSGMDVTARIIGGELYFAAQKQNIACGLFKLTYK